MSRSTLDLHRDKALSPTVGAQKPLPRSTSGSPAGGLERAVAETFALADVALDGRRPWDIQVCDRRFFQALATRGSLGLGEAYMAGWWATGNLEDFFHHVYRADIHYGRLTWGARFHYLVSRLFNRQKISRAFQVGERHYDRGNRLYQAMLGPRMVYSSGYWTDGVDDLAAAEEAKLDLICRKLDLRPGQRILDIGCGWGCFGQWATERHGVEVVGITVSKEQAALARERCAGLPVEIRLCDYRAIEGRFDHVVSIGMMGHVGYKNYRTLMEVVHRSLADDGLFLIHTMGANRSTTAAEPWIDHYIFPNGMAPSIPQVGEAIEHLLVLEDWHNFSTDYHRSTLAWRDNVAERWGTLADLYDERFRRMWTYYLCCFAGAFSARTLQTWDIVLSKVGGHRGRYASVR